VIILIRSMIEFLSYSYC